MPAAWHQELHLVISAAIYYNVNEIGTKIRGTLASEASRLRIGAAFLLSGGAANYKVSPLHERAPFLGSDLMLISYVS